MSKRQDTEVCLIFGTTAAFSSLELSSSPELSHPKPPFNPATTRPPARVLKTQCLCLRPGWIGVTQECLTSVGQGRHSSDEQTSPRLPYFYSYRLEHSRPCQGSSCYCPFANHLWKAWPASDIAV